MHHDAPTRARPMSAPIVVGVGAFALYVFTAARAPQFGDGLELLASAAVGGIPHPTGYPLLQILLGPLAHGEGAYFRGALLNGLFAAGTAVLLTLLAGALPRSAGGNGQHRWIAPALGAVAAASAALWSAATVVEVYALNALLLAALLVILAPAGSRPLDFRLLGLAGLVQGLALANHLSSLCLAPVLVWRVLQAIRQGNRPALTLAWPTIGVLLGLLVYLYIPLRAAANPPINWGNPEDWAGFQWLVGGGDYRDVWFLSVRQGIRFAPSEYLAFVCRRVMELTAVPGCQILGGLDDFRRALAGLGDPQLPGLRVGFLFRAVLALVLGGLLWAVVLLGGIRLWKEHKPSCLALSTPIALQFAFIATYNIPDIADYYLGLLVTLFPFLAVGMVDAACHAAKRFRYDQHPASHRRLPVFGGLIVLIALLSNWQAADRSRDDFAAIWLERLMAAVPEKAVLITHGDADIYGAWYVQHVLQRRDDMFVVGANFLRNEWYDAMLPTDDPLGRRGIVEPGAFQRFRLEDQVALVSRSVIEPNLGIVPIVTTNADPYVVQGLGELYEIQTIAMLITEEEALELQSQGRAMPPVLLLGISRK